VVDHRPGVTWLPEAVRELARDWPHDLIVADPVSPAGPSIDALTRLGVPVTPVTSRQYADACQGFYDTVCETDTLVVRASEAAAPLEAAVAAAGRRPMGDAWVWNRRASVPISPLVAATLAQWGVTRPAEPDPFIV
jgi:hypothetical protein